MCAVIGIVSLIQIIFVLTPFALFVCSFISKEEIVAKDRVFFRKWGSLYDEFKLNKGFFSSQYYSVYFLRRLGYMLSQVYLCSRPYLQGIFNIIGSLVQTSYLLYYLPFKNTGILLSTICGEISTTFTMILSFTFLFDFSIAVQDLIEKAAMYTVMFGMAAQFIISLYLFAQAMYYVWQKAQKMRAKSFLENSAMRKTIHNTEDNSS